MVKMSKERPSRLLVGLSFGALVLLAASGCQKDNITYTGLTSVTPTEPSPDLDAPGTVMEATPALVNPTRLASTKTYGVRSNPFALLGVERTFHLSQQTEKFLADFGGWEPFDVPEIFREPPPEVLPLPQWRLSGVIIGNGVLALLDTGRDVYEIRPGMTIPDTEWRVASIDSERAILVRDNAVPSEFYVELQGIIGGGPGGFGAPRPSGAGGTGDTGAPSGGDGSVTAGR